MNLRLKLWLMDARDSAHQMLFPKHSARLASQERQIADQQEAYTKLFQMYGHEKLRATRLKGLLYAEREAARIRKELVERNRAKQQ